jgi:hypothetical protein
VAAKPRWWRHIPEIRSMLADVRLPVLDRAAVEQLFGLRRRQAIELMNRFGGYQTGRTLLIGRDQLLAAIEGIAASGEYEQETTRRERLAAAVERIRRTRQSEAVRIPIAPEVFRFRMDTLGTGVALRPGRLEIEFSGPEELLTKLFGLAQAIANDYGGFERTAVGACGREQVPA